MNKSTEYHLPDNADPGEIPGQLSKKNVVSENSNFLADQSLGIFQKILLTTDGTVTDLIALYTGKPIKVKKVGQKMFHSDDRQAFFCSPGTPLLERNILLCSDNKNYLYAESVFVFGLLSRSIQYKLLETDCPIGLMWKEEKLETYRDIIGYKTEVCDKISAYFDVLPETPIISRVYSIYHQGEILGTITEKFPVTYFREIM